MTNGIPHPFEIFWDVDTASYYIFVPDGCVLVNGVAATNDNVVNENLALDFDDTPPEKVYCHVIKDRGAWKFTIDGEAEEEGAKWNVLVATFGNEDNDGQSYDVVCSAISLGDDVVVDEISIESSREIPSEIEGEEPTVVEELAIKGWHDKDNSAQKLGSLLSGATEDTSRQVLVRNGKGGATEYLPLGKVPSAKNGKLTFKFADGSSDKEFTANQDDNSPVTVNIPSAANNGRLTIKNSDGSTNATFTANQAGNEEVTLPVSANNGTLTITQGGTTLGTFTANQSTHSTIAIPAPPQPIQPNNGKLTLEDEDGTNLGEFTANQAGDKTITIPSGAKDGKLLVKFGTDAAVQKFSANQSDNSTIQFAKVASTGSYNDLADKPAIPAAANDGKLKVQFGTDAAVQKFSANQSDNSTIQFAKVASTGSYNDLVDKPAIPTLPTTSLQFVGDIRYDTSTHQLQKRIYTLDWATGVVTQGNWTMITGGQAVPFEQ